MSDQNKDRRKRWYKKQSWIITFLILYFPIGLFLMWKFAEWTKKTKTIITVLIALCILLEMVLLVLLISNSTPVITVNNAENNIINTDEDKYELTGSATSVSGQATLTINDNEIDLSDGYDFQYRTVLDEGDNEFNLVASNKNGETKEVITIHRTTEAEFSAREEAKKVAAEKAAAEKAKKEESKKQKAEKKNNAKTKDAQKDDDTNAAAKARQATIDRFAPEYCKNKQHTKVKLSDSGRADGWPGNDGSGWTNEECVTIASKLYDNGAAEKELEVVIKGNYGIGMLEMSLLYSLGSPNNINRTHRSGYTQAQYVYGNSLSNTTYIYTENGIVTSVQN